MIPSFNHDYYKKMLELQEKLRKSEKERIRLEERFNLIEQESRLKHEACVNKLQKRYIEFLEEQRVRDERNHKLLSALDRVDESLALITARTDRLCTLRKEYETCLMRACINRQQAGSVTGDSGVVSQNEERQMQKDIRNLSHSGPRSRYGIERRLHSSYISPGISGNVYNSMNTSGASLNRISSVQWAPKSSVNYSEFLEDPLAEAAKNGQNDEFPFSSNHTWADEYVTNDLDPVLKKNACKNFLTKDLSRLQYPERLGSTMRIPKLTNILGTLSNSKKERVNGTLENELERYIYKIRSLHDNNDLHSLEEIEQNTSGDLLNVTLSDDGLDHLPVEEITKEREIPTEVGAILAVADDLVSKVVDGANNSNHVVSDKNTEETSSDENACQKSLNTLAAGNHGALINATVNNSDMQPVTSTSVCALVEKDEIKADVAINTTKLNPLVENNEIVTKPTSIENSSYSNCVNLQKDNIEIRNEFETFANINPLETMSLTELLNEQREVDENNHAEIVSEIKSQDKKISEIEISVNENSNSADKWLRSKTDAPNIDTGEKSFRKENQDENNMKQNEINIGTEIITESPISSNDKLGEEIENISITNYDVCEQNYENSHADHYAEPYNQDSQVYPHDPHQIYEYNNEQYHHGSNQQYQYDPNLQYEQNPVEQYQFNQQNSQYMEDSNRQYHNQQYIDNDSQQYVINPNEQYHEYSVNPNQEYQSETYVQNPSTTYDQNAVYTYSTQNQNYAAEKVYDESQSFVSNQHNQSYREPSNPYEILPDVDEKTAINYQLEDLSNETNDNYIKEHHEHELSEKEKISTNEHTGKKSMDVIKSILDSDSESIMEKNISNTESDFDFN